MFLCPIAMARTKKTNIGSIKVRNRRFTKLIKYVLVHDSDFL